MPFSSTLKCYREGSPPSTVTVRQLGRFIERWMQAGAGTGKPALGFNAKVKYGRRIDIDERGSSWIRWINPYIGSPQEIRWDLEEQAPTLFELAERLGKLEGSIYRARLSMDSAVPAIVDPSIREAGTQNSETFSLYEWSFDIGPIELSSMGTDLRFQVGWMSLNLWGYGYPFPWTFQEVYDRMLPLPGLHAAQRVCEETWPGSQEQPSAKLVRQRTRLKDLWPSTTTDQPVGWQWGLRA